MKAYMYQMFAILVLLTVGVTTVAAADDAAAGKTVYAKKCMTCHAADGKGNPGMAKALKVDITPLSSDEVQKKSEAELEKIITKGTGKMKAVAGLSDEDKERIIAYIRTFKK